MSGFKKTKPITPVATMPAIPMAIDWSAQHALVMGLGESGLAALRWLSRKNARVTVLDTRAAPPMLARAQEIAAAAAGRMDIHVNARAPLAANWLSGISMVIPSPGLTPRPVHQSMIADILEHAQRQGIDVFGELDLFEWAIHHAAHASGASDRDEDLELPLELPKVLAITGTNGKTTTTQMTVALLRRAGFDAQEAGNISPSLLDAVMAREDESRFPQAWVIELSSFQLAMARHFHPTAAALLNITEDHLDWHSDMDDYVASKHRVFGIGTDAATSGVLCVANRQDARVMQGLEKQSRITTFGTGLPPAPGDFGLADEGLVWMVMRDAHDEERVHRLMPADALRARGRHNAMNAMAALALCRAVTPALAPLLHGLREFRSGAHRMQWVTHVSGVDFVDDSKGTNVGATVAAIEGLGLPLVLIAGGEGKGQDFSPLGPALAAHAKAVVLIGKDAPAIATVARSAGVKTAAADSMADAVREAFELAQPNAVVLLSPACASFDMFANYMDRARAFHEAVTALADAQGVMC